MSEMMWGGRFQKAEERSALISTLLFPTTAVCIKKISPARWLMRPCWRTSGIISKEDLEKITEPFGN